MCDKGLNVEVIHKLPIGFWAESIFFHLNGHEEKTFEYDVIPVRGRYEIEAPTLIVSDVHGLYYDEIKIDSKIELEIYPSLDGIRRDVEADVGATILHTKLGLQTSEIDSLRRYQQGDDLKYVEWKATTRLGDLVVKYQGNALSLEQAQVNGWVSMYLFGYDTVSGGYGMVYPPEGVLRPWTGYWIRAYLNCEICIPPIPAPPVPPNALVQPKDLGLTDVPTPPPLPYLLILPVQPKT